MEYRNITYYLIYFPSMIFLVGFPFYFQIGKSELGIVLYVIYVFILVYLSSFIQKKYWSWILKKRRQKTYELLNKSFKNIELLEDNEYLSLKLTNRNVLLKFDFANYPPHRFSTPKNRLEIYLEISDRFKDYKSFKIINIDNRYWIYQNKVFKIFFINRSIENLVKNCKNDIGKLIEKDI